MPQHPGALLQAPGCERDVAGDDDVLLGDVLDDPVVRTVELFFDHLQRQPVSRRVSHPVVGHQNDLQSVALGYPIDLLLDRAAVGVNVDIQHCEAPVFRSARAADVWAVGRLD